MPASTEKYFPVRRAAEYLGCDSSFIYYLIDSGQIKAHPTGGKKHYSIPESELLKFSVYRQMKEDGMNVSISADSDAIEVSNEKYYRTKDVAQLCGMSDGYIRNLVSKGYIKPDKVEKHHNNSPIWLFSESQVLEFLNAFETGKIPVGRRGRKKKVEKTEETEPIEVPMTKEEIQDRLPEDVKERFDKDYASIINRINDVKSKSVEQYDRMSHNFNELKTYIQNRDDVIISTLKSLGEGFTDVKTIYENTYAEVYHSAFKMGYETGFKDGKAAAMERAYRVYGYSAKGESNDE